jgi:hypothetical protein
VICTRPHPSHDFETISDDKVIQTGQLDLTKKMAMHNPARIAKVAVCLQPRRYELLVKMMGGKS